MMKPQKGRKTSWGKASALLPNKTSLNRLNRSPRSILDYSKEVPTNPTDPQQGSPLLVNLAAKGKF